MKPSKLRTHFKQYTAYLQGVNLRAHAAAAIQFTHQTILILSAATLLLTASPTIRHLAPFATNAWYSGASLGIGFAQSHDLYYELSDWRACDSNRNRILENSEYLEKAEYKKDGDRLVSWTWVQSGTHVQSKEFWHQMHQLLDGNQTLVDRPMLLGGCGRQIVLFNLHWLDFLALIAAILSPFLVSRLGEACLEARYAFTDQYIILFDPNAPIVRPQSTRPLQIILEPIKTFLWVLLGSPDLQSWRTKIGS